MRTPEIDNNEIKKAIKKTQDKKRFYHTLGVAYTATALAMKYQIDLKTAELAGLLHDCAKCLSHEEKIEICVKNGIEMTEVEKRNPFLLHAKVGSFLARTEYGVEDQDILNAILNHTTGRPDMSLLEKIIFIADYIEPGRDQAPNLEAIRKSAFEDIDRTLLWILEDTLAYLHSGGGETDPMTQKTYDYYKERIQK